MKRVTDMTQGNPVKLVLSFAFPLVLANLGQQLYLIADASIVGRGVGVQALAAVGASEWIYWLVLWTVSGMTQGFATFICQDFGRKDMESLNKTLAQSVLLCGLIGIFFTVCGTLLARPALTLLHTPEEVLSDAATYLITMLCGTLVVTAYNMASSILRAFGNGRAPLVAMVIAAVLNIGLDCLFVLAFHWGVFGAAIASVLAQMISVLYCMTQIVRIPYIHMRPEHWKPDFARMKQLMVFGLPLALEYIFIAGSGIVMQSTVNAQGSEFMAGFTSTNKIYGLLESAAISFGLAFATFFSQNFGAGNLHRVKQGVRLGLLICAIMAAVVTTAMLLVGENLLLLFLDASAEDGAAALEVGTRYLMVTSTFLILLYPIHIYRNGLQSVGNSFWPMMSGLTESIVRALISTVGVKIIGKQMLFYTEPASWFMALAFSMVPFYIMQSRMLRKLKKA